ncbi:hypothetical protein FF2_024739 [Malus domestica]
MRSSCHSHVTCRLEPPPHPGLDSTVVRYCPLWAPITPSRFCFWELTSNFPVGHPSWDCFRTNSLNFEVPMEPETNELQKSLVLVFPMTNEIKDLSIPEIFKAADNFNQANIIVEGFGLVYRATLANGTRLAVKKLLGDLGLVKGNSKQKLRYCPLPNTRIWFPCLPISCNNTKVRNTGSRMEIGNSISHFGIMSPQVVFVLLLFAFTNIYMKDINIGSVDRSSQKTM